MGKKESEKVINHILDLADIKINGKRKFDIKVNNDKLYDRILKGGTLALGESYMDGWWDCEDLSEFFCRVQNRTIEESILKDKKVFVKLLLGNWKLITQIFLSKIFNMQTRKRANQVIEEHYDIGNDLYSLMLDETMGYTCGYWKGAKTLKQAQENKYDLICKKLELKKGMTVLDIGCGFGSFAKYAAENYDVNVTGITLSKEQLKLAKERCKGLNVKFLLKDYRDMNTKFDRVLSIGMFEAVGHKNYREYMKVVNRCLKNGGMSLLHTIGRNSTSTTVEPWINKYIFPNGMLPSLKQISESIEELFVIEDLHSFGPYYDKTLLAWEKNFAKNWNKLKSEKYNERFYRMWRYYLLSCAGSFRSRDIQLWQIVLTKKGDCLCYERKV